MALGGWGLKCPPHHTVSRFGCLLQPNLTSNCFLHINPDILFRYIMMDFIM